MNKTYTYDNIIVGAGAAGLFCGAFSNLPGETVILEKTKKAGTKLLMSGAGQCNLTNNRPIKEFIDYYGDKGKKIRSCLYKHSNLEFCEKTEALGVPLFTREDGKIFPKSMSARQVLDALLSEIKKKNIEIKYGCSVSQINAASEGYEVSTESGQTFTCKNLIIACGGSSYPTTGSDGSILKVIERDLQMDIISPRPSLVPAYIENYPFSDLSGLSICDAAVKIFPGREGKMTASVKGDLLFTHKNLSGPVIINNSRYMKTGGRLEINFTPDTNSQELESRMKQSFSGNSRSVENWLADNLNLAKRFAECMANMCSISGRKVSSLKGDEIKYLCRSLCQSTFTISGLGSFKEAMATAGGVSLKEVNPTTMEARRHPGLYFIGEVLDIDGDTGGYNLQFAYSSAMVCADNILK